MLKNIMKDQKSDFKVEQAAELLAALLLAQIEEKVVRNKRNKNEKRKKARKDNGHD